MSVLIRDMEMPKSCYVCPFCDYVSARCDAVKGNPYTPESRYEKRAGFCPLVPAPPHGRLIDADALIKDLAIDDLDDKTGATLLMAVFLEVLKAAPTIIPASGGKEDE